MNQSVERNINLEVLRVHDSENALQRDGLFFLNEVISYLEVIWKLLL